MTVRVFLLDDHEIVRRGVRELLEANEGIEVVGEAATAEEGMARIPAVRPDVAVVDMRLPDGNGVEVCREVRSRERVDQLPHPHVVRRRRGALRLDHGRRGGLPPEADQGNRSRRHDPQGRLGSVAARPQRDRPGVGAAAQGSRGRRAAPWLTEQERKILDLIAEGLTNRQIGERMFLAEKTVKNYVSNLLSKLGMERRTEAAVFAAKLPPKRGTEAPPES